MTIQKAIDLFFFTTYIVVASLLYVCTVVQYLRDSMWFATTCAVVGTFLFVSAVKFASEREVFR